MGKMKAIDINGNDRDTVAACRFDDTGSFSDAVIETGRDETPAASKHRPHAAAPSAPASSPDVLVDHMDLCDPAHVAKLAARYEAMNLAMKRMAREHAGLSSDLDAARQGLEKAEAQAAALAGTIESLETELGHAREKLAISRTKGQPSLRQQVVCNILTLGGAGSVLLFAGAFLFY